MRLHHYALFALLAGCVSRNNHELVVMQLDATRTALSNQQGQNRQDDRALRARITELEAQIHQRQLQLDALDARHGAHEAELHALRTEYAELLSLASTPYECPKPPDPRRRRKTESECPAWEVEPAIGASIDQMARALAMTAKIDFEDGQLSERHAETVAAFATLSEEGWVRVERRDHASVVTLPAAKVFQEGKVHLSPRGEDILTRTAAALDSLHGRHMEIRGHTDNQPFSSTFLASNWELGFARAMAVLRFLREHGTDQPVHSESWADTQPIADNNTADGRKANARVEIWLTGIEGVEEIFTPSPPEEPEPEPEPEEPAP